MQIRIAQIIDQAYTDGPGERVSLYTKGCPIRCIGCQNPHLFEMTGGDMWPAGALAIRLLDTNRPISILGGEPLAQPYAVAELLRIIRHYAPDIHIILYTGYTWEAIRQMMTSGPVELRSAIELIVSFVNVVVDGPFILEQDDPYLQYRGSRNQRPINVAAMRDAFDFDALILENWDTPRIKITEDGAIMGAIGLMADVFPDDDRDAARRCGQTR